MMPDLEPYRPRLFGIAYRMLGVVHDAEDLVQETMLRWQQADQAAIREPEAWLVSVVTRLSIDRLRRAATERVEYPGPWLPEPAADERFAADRPAEIASDLSMAFLVLLERLAPEERAALLLRDVFDVGYVEIARVIEKSEAAARQTVSRARERIRADRQRFIAPMDAKERLFARFMEALQSDDMEGMLAVLAPDVTWTSDGGGKVSAIPRIIDGADRVARLVLGYAKKARGVLSERMERFNGEPAMVSAHAGGVFAITFCETDGERIVALYRVMNPEKLGEAH